MKIVHIIFSFNIGGSETMLIDIVNEQCKHADVAIIVVNNIYSIDLLRKLNPTVKYFLIERKPRSRSIFPIIKLYIILFKLRPNVIHCHNYNLGPILFLFKRKLYLTVHDVGINTNYHKLYRKVFAISEAVKKDIISKCNLMPIVVYNGIHIEMIKQKNNYELNNPFKIVCVSRLEHEKKGQDILLRAISLLKSKYNINIQLDLIGTGSSLQYLQNLSKELNIETQVNFLGLKTREYIYNNLCNYHLFVQPSRYEGFGLTIIEAMAAKLPVLVSNIDGPMEVINYGEYGYWFESGNHEHLAERIYYIYNNYKSYEIKILTEKSYHYVKTNFDVTKTSQMYVVNYNS